MLVPYERFIDTPVMSLQTGSELARTARSIINPRNLTIAAFELEGKNLTQQPSLLLIEDIREVGNIGIIIDSTDELISPSDVVKIKEIYEFNFELIGKKVVDDQKKYTGKVSGYTIDSSSFVIQQIIVKQPLLKRISESEVLIHRSQIIKVSDKDIVVKSPSIEKKTDDAIENSEQQFVNPFRDGPKPASHETLDNY